MHLVAQIGVEMIFSILMLSNVHSNLLVFLQFKTAYLPIFFDSDMLHEGSWIYLALYVTLLKVSRCDILAKDNFLRTTFRKFWCRAWPHTENSESSKNCSVIFFQTKNLHEHCVYYENCFTLVCSCFHFITAGDNVFENCLCLLLPCWS